MVVVHGQGKPTCTRLQAFGCLCLRGEGEGEGEAEGEAESHSNKAMGTCGRVGGGSLGRRQE